jgi:mRNA-degrading endonuclease YafQ of YafQ-DinJ toxin-antitoxin module
MKLRLTKSFEQEYRKVVKGNDILKERVDKQLLILQQNISHPSLRLHKLGSSQYWFISVDKSIQVLLMIEKDYLAIYHIGKHEEVY